MHENDTFLWPRSTATSHELVTALEMIVQNLKDLKLKEGGNASCRHVDVEAGNFDLVHFSDTWLFQHDLFPPVCSPLLTHTLLWHVTCLLFSCVSSGCRGTKSPNLSCFMIELGNSYQMSELDFLLSVFALDTYATIVSIKLHNLILWKIKLFIQCWHFVFSAITWLDLRHILLIETLAS